MSLTQILGKRGRFEVGSYDYLKKSCRFYRIGGFPEPYLKQEKTFHRRWLRSRRERITHEDVRDLTRIEDVDRLEFLIRLLNPRIAAPLPLNSLREDLGIAFETVRAWIATLERLYYIYGVKPYSQRLQRAIKREQKYYFWDWSEVRDEAARFENLVMSHLLRACHIWTDFGLGEFCKKRCQVLTLDISPLTRVDNLLFSAISFSNLADDLLTAL